GRCQANSGPSDSGGGGATQDSGTNVGIEAGVDAGACIPPSDEPASVQCGSTTCEPGFRCCNVGSALNCVDETACADDKIVWSCETKTDCLYGAAFCCVTGSPTTGAVCSSTLENGKSECMVDPEKCADPTQNFVACASADECTTNKCEPIEVRTKGGFS